MATFNMPTSFDTLLPEAEDLQVETIRLRRDLHQIPELGLDNPRTQERLLDSLDGLGLDIRKHARLLLQARKRLDQNRAVDLAQLGKTKVLHPRLV